MKLRKKIALLVGTVLLNAAAVAADVNDFHHKGHIHRYDKENRFIVIGDSSYRLADAVRIFAESGRTLNTDALKDRLDIRYKLALVANGRGFEITDVVVFGIK